jgi:EmrB/QacA subfamily drug resistance transporter
VSHKWWALIAVCVASFMLLLDITIVNVALPEIGRDLGGSFTELQWVIDSYVLALASLTLLAGSLADRLGRRLVFVAGLGIFTLASLLAGLAADILMLNLARGLQGVGGAAMFGTVLALIAQEFAPRDRGVALGAWGASVGAAVAVGPLVGGALTDGFGWEWIFYINVPVGLATIGATVLRVRESRAAVRGPIDWGGFLTFSSALFLLVYAVLRGNDAGWTSAAVVLPLVAAAALLAAFVVVERRHPSPMLDVRLFRIPAFAGASLGALAIAGSMFSMLLYFVLYFQDHLGYSPLETGVRFLPVTLTAFFVAPLAAKLAERVPLRALLALGLGLTGAGFLAIHGVAATDGWTTLLAGMLLIGVGAGLVNPTLAAAAIGVVDEARAGMAAGINNTFRQVGVAVGVAALGALFEHRLDDQLATGAAPDVAFVGAFDDIVLVAGIVAFVGAALTAALVRQGDLHQEPPVRAAEGESHAERIAA